MEILRAYFGMIRIVEPDRLVGRPKDEERIAGGIVVPRKVKAK